MCTTSWLADKGRDPAFYVLVGVHVHVGERACGRVDVHVRMGTWWLHTHIWMTTWSCSVLAGCLQGGANAGHTIYDDAGTKYALHLVPSGILNKQATCVVGNGVVLHLPSLFEEIEELKGKGVHVGDRLKISDRAHLLFDLHKEIDGLRESELAGEGKEIGTTKRGIGPAYSSKATRNGVRVCDLKHMDTFADKLRKLALDGSRRFKDFKYDVEADIKEHQTLAKRLLPFVTDTGA